MKKGKRTKAKSSKPKHQLKPVVSKPKDLKRKDIDPEYIKRIMKAYGKEHDLPKTRKEYNAAVKSLRAVTAKPPTKKELEGLTKKEQKELKAIRHLTVLSAKNIRIQYRDKDGKLTKPGSNKKMKIEVWRIKKSEDGKHQLWRKVHTDKKYYARKREMKPIQIAMILRKQWKDNSKIRIEIVDGNVYIWTET